MGLGGSRPHHTSSHPGPGHPKPPAGLEGTLAPGSLLCHAPSRAAPAALPGTYALISGHGAKWLPRKPPQACRDLPRVDVPCLVPLCPAPPSVHAHAHTHTYTCACISIRATHVCSMHMICLHAHTCTQTLFLERAPSGVSDSICPMGLMRRGSFWNSGCHMSLSSPLSVPLFGALRQRLCCSVFPAARPHTTPHQDLRSPGGGARPRSPAQGHTGKA